MLGPIGRAGSNFLRSRGYEITRPTWIEKNYTRSPWRILFGGDIETLAAVYRQNRNTLSEVKQWVSPETLKTSLWRYGVLPEWEASRNDSYAKTGLLDVERDLTAADFLGLLAHRFQPISYLEIGVSVGKNFYQIVRNAKNSNFVALDVEEINPVLVDLLGEPEAVWTANIGYKVETHLGTSVTKRSSLKRINTSDGNTVEYLSADQFRPDTWKALDGHKFNLIFSDGVHTGEALRTEFNHIGINNLVDPDKPFHMLWDDMWNIEMQSAFFDCAKQLTKLFDVGDEAIALLHLYGSYGERRLMGFFSNVFA